MTHPLVLKTWMHEPRQELVPLPEASKQIQGLRPALHEEFIELELISGRRFSFRNAEVSYRLDGWKPAPVDRASSIRGAFAAFNAKEEK